MIKNQEKSFLDLKRKISKVKSIINEINSIQNNLDQHGETEQSMASAQLKSLKEMLKKENQLILEILKGINVSQSLPTAEEKVPEGVVPEESVLPKAVKGGIKKFYKKEEEVVIKTEIKPSSYIRFENKIFSGLSESLIRKGWFRSLDNSLKKLNAKFLLKSYVSRIFLTTLIASIFAFFIFTFFQFFSMTLGPPFITRFDGNSQVRLLKTLGILFIIPISVFLFTYFYPYLERKSLERKINQELPFATINMAAISGSMINPVKIFNIIVATKEYPTLEKEFVKIINGINVLGYNFVTVLRASAINSPSKKLADLLNGLATIINSGGDLPKFFDERAKTLLFEYNLERVKEIKASETFMDIYISVVIAAPMIMMLLLIIIQISGMGISLSMSEITVVIALAVITINIIFITFLHIKESKD